jgi:signal transduction histidine kinase
VQPPSKIESTEYTSLNRVVMWFLTLRWIAAGGVLASLIVTQFAFSYSLPFRILYALTGILITLNLAFSIYYTAVRRRNLSREEMRVFFHMQVCLDYVLLLFFGYFTGFLENPIMYYFVFHIMLTSFLFRGRVVFVYVASLLAVLISVMTAEYFRLIPHFPLYPGNRENYRELFFIKASGLFTTLVISAYLIASIKNRIEERGRKVEIELNRYKSLDKIKSNFILQVTHEIRGPLAALKGFHALVLKGITGNASARTREVIQRADRRTENLINMVDEMIDYAYMQAEEGGHVSYRRDRVSVRQAIEQNLELFAGGASERKVRFASNCPRDLVVSANRDLMNIILSNLISNAVKYSRPDTVVTVNGERDGDRAHIIVRDEGMGIKPEEIDHIFEEFYRTRMAREVERDGTGLGLPIVRKAVDSLEGNISVYSEVDVGTTFHVYIPSS